MRNSVLVVAAVILAAALMIGCGMPVGTGSAEPPVVPPESAVPAGSTAP